MEPPFDRPTHELWYDLGSVEAFYQFNKFLQAKE
jgi:hypothetical protein